MSRGCYYDTSGCLVCPELPAVVGHPSYYEQQAIIGWNAGANSVDQVDGDLHTVFTMPAGTVGAVVGLKSVRTKQTLPGAVEHGWYFQSVGGVDMAQVIELGAVKTPIMERLDTDVFEIRRTNDIVQFFMNNVEQWRSKTPSYGPKIVNACLYASGDAVPGSS